MSGGTGQDEARAIERAGRQWPLTLQFAVKEKQHAEIAADVTVAVRDPQGHTALATRAQGPFLVTRMAPSACTVDVTFAGMALHRKVVIEHGHPAHAVFVWPTGPGETGMRVDRHDSNQNVQVSNLGAAKKSGEQNQAFAGNLQA